MCGSVRSATYTWNGNNGTAWATTTNWSPAGNPGSGVGDVVIIATAANQPVVTVAPANPLASITFNPSNATAISLTINGVTLTVSGAVVLNNLAGSNSSASITGTGTLSCGSLTVGSGVGPSAVTTRVTTITSSIANLIVGSDLTVKSNIGSSTSRIANSSFSQTTGNVTAAAIVTDNQNAVNTSTYTLGATSSPTLKLTGAVPITKAPLGTSNINLNGSGSTVEYSNSASVTFLTTPAAYVNLIISGGSGAVKKLSANTTVIGTLTVRAQTTFSIETFTLGTPSGVVMENVAGGDGAKITGTGQFTIGGNITVNHTGSGTLGNMASIAPPIAIGGVTRTIAVNDDGTAGNDDFEVSSVISGNAGFGIQKTGTGTLVLSGQSTYSGNTTIAAGILRLGAAGNGTNTPLGIVSSTRTIVSSGAALDLSGITLSTAEPITINGTGVASGGALMNSDAIAATYSGLLTIGSDASVVAGTGAIHISNTGTVTGSGFDLVLGGAAGGSFASVLGTGTGQLSKEDAGTWIVSGASTFSGLVNINAGILRLGAAGSGANSPLGVVSGRTIVNIGGALDLNGFTLTTAEPITLSGIGPSLGGAMMNTSTTAVTYSGLVTVGNPGASIVGGAGSIALSNPGTITGSGFPLTLGGSVGGSMTSVLGTGTGTLIKAGSGTWTISGLNTFTGQVTINAGILKLGAAGNGTNTPLGTVAGGVVVNTNGSLDLAGFTLGTAEPVTINGAGLFSGGAVMNSSSTSVNYTGLVTLGADASIKGGAGLINLTHTGNITGSGFTLLLGGAAGGSIAGVIATDGGGVTKEDAGTWTLSGASTYTGATTVNAGLLKAGIANNAFGLNAALVMANVSGAVLETTGYDNTIGSITGGGSNGGNIVLGAAVLTIGTDNTSPAKYDGVISGTGSIIKTGTGTLQLGGSSSYSGSTTINNGIIKLAGTGNATQTPLGAVSGATIVNTGGALDLGGFTLAAAEPLTLNGTGISAGGALMNSGAAADYVGAVVLGSTGTSIIGGTGAINITYTGPITGAGFTMVLGGAAGGSISSIIGTGSGGITKAGSGTWILQGSNTYTGATNINGGVLKAGIVTNAFGINSAITLANALTAAIDITGYDNTIGSLGGGGNTGGNVFLGAAKLTIGTDNTSPAEYAGIISGNGGSITKNGTGTLTLGGSNTFTGGVILNAGTLNINHTQALGAEPGSFVINGGTIDNTSGSALTMVNYPMQWNGDFTFTGSAALDMGSGAITVNANRAVTTAASTLKINGTLSTSFHFTKAGAGTLHLGTANIAVNSLTITGGTLVSTSGTLSIAGAFGVSGTFTHNSGTVDFNGAAQVIPGVVFHHLVFSNDGSKTILDGISVTCYTLTINGSAYLEAQGDNALTVTRSS